MAEGLTDTYQDLLFCAFHSMFVIIAHALITGTPAGLVAIIPGTGFVNPVSAMIMDGVAGVLCSAAVAYSVVLTFIILKVIDLTLGLRVNIEDEAQGVDATSHGEAGCNI